MRQKQAEFGTQIYLVSDEPYKKLLYDGLVYPEVYPHYANSIVVTSHAKDLALPGERIGYIATHPGCPEVEELQDGFSFANRTLGFVNAPALMQHVVAQLQGVTIDMRQYERKRDFCARIWPLWAISSSRRKAGFISFRAALLRTMWLSSRRCCSAAS